MPAHLVADPHAPISKRCTSPALFSSSWRINKDVEICNVVSLWFLFSFFFFHFLWQKEAFKYWFEAATKGHPGSCLTVGEGVSSGLYVERNCPMGVV